MSITRKLLSWALAGVVLLSACGAPGAGGDPEGSPVGQPAAPFDCPVTIPPEGGFAPPPPYPAAHPHEGLVWYGTDGLWTALALAGDHTPRKSVWWSANFPGGAEEEQPDLWVEWRRLDAGEAVVIDNEGSATSGFTPEEEWFMIAGLDPDEPGCWEVEAAYKGATLSYVFEVP